MTILLLLLLGDFKKKRITLRCLLVCVVWSCY